MTPVLLPTFGCLRRRLFSSFSCPPFSILLQWRFFIFPSRRVLSSSSLFRFSNHSSFIFINLPRLHSSVFQNVFESSPTYISSWCKKEEKRKLKYFPISSSSPFFVPICCHPSVSHLPFFWMFRRQSTKLTTSFTQYLNSTYFEYYLSFCHFSTVANVVQKNSLFSSSQSVSSSSSPPPPPPPPRRNSTSSCSSPSVYCNDHDFEGKCFNSSLAFYRAAFDRVVITDSLERVVNANVSVNMTGSEIIYEMLANYGVEFVFGYSGGAVLPLIDVFFEKDIKMYNNCNEQCVGHAAAAVGKTTGKPGIVIVTSGPGLTNMITPLQDAFMDGVPMIVISGQVPASVIGTDAFQECPATALTKLCTKWSCLVQNVESLPWILSQAFTISMSGRKGPVHIDMPKNILAGSGDIPLSHIRPGGLKDLGESAGAKENLKLFVSEDQIRQVARMINDCNKPVLYVGQGAMNASIEVRELAIKAQIPVTTTVHAMGIFDEFHPLSLHMLGMHGAAYANYAIQNADCIIAIGSRFDDRTTGNVSEYAPAAREAAKLGMGGIIHMDILLQQMGKIVEPTVFLLGDCQTSLRRLLPYITALKDQKELKQKNRNNWLSQVDYWKKIYPFQFEKDYEGRIKTQQVVQAIYQATLNPKIVNPSKNVFVSTGVGNHQMMVAQFFRWRQPRCIVTSGGLGTMGVGLPFAIGAQVANPNDLVVLIDGDGSFNMTSVDLATVRRYDLPLKIAIMNDGVQQMVRVWQNLFFDSRHIMTDNACPDYCKLAQAYGIASIKCTTTDELWDAIEIWLKTDGPILADFHVLPDICLPMVQPGKALHEMLLSKTQAVSAKMEGLAPS